MVRRSGRWMASVGERPACAWRTPGPPRRTGASAEACSAQAEPPHLRAFRDRCCQGSTRRPQRSAVRERLRAVPSRVGYSYRNGSNQKLGRGVQSLRQHPRRFRSDPSRSSNGLIDALSRNTQRRSKRDLRKSEWLLETPRGEDACVLGMRERGSLSNLFGTDSPTLPVSSNRVGFASTRLELRPAQR